MIDDFGKEVFERIREKPYRVQEVPGVPAPNCYYKGLELIDNLTRYGYAVRGRTGEMDWADTIVPDDIVTLFPDDLRATHFFIEVLHDGEWKILDASWQSAMAGRGAVISEWGQQNEPGFKLTKLYSHEEQLAYMRRWLDPAVAEAYFAKAGPFFTAVNEWLESIDD